MECKKVWRITIKTVIHLGNLLLRFLSKDDKHNANIFQ